MGIDVAISEWAFSLGRQAEPLVVFLAQYLPYLLGAAVLIWVLQRRDGKIFLQLAATAILSRLIFVEAIRFFWDRSRPFIELGFTPLIEHDPSGSFPSGHAAFFFALSAVVFAKDKKTGMVFLFLSSLIVVARVFAGVHWFSDVLAGAVIGVLSAWLILKLFLK
ncbi:MAG: phosphatase PAP2 family protein [bacterium]|nr:phosphatase PAP2 family protein [bacterium]